MAFLVGGANSSAVTAYNIDNSLRFNDDDSPYLSFTPSSASNRRTFTFSAWIKLGVTSSAAQRGIFGSYTSGNDTFNIEIGDDGKFNMYEYISGYNIRVGSTMKLRDLSAWYHLVVAVDTTQATDTNRVKLYVNGTQVTDLSTSTYPSENYDTRINNTSQHEVGIVNGAYYWDGYMAEVFFIDGTAYAASDFGETDSDSGIWKPKDCKNNLTFGTNGFYLEFKETGTSADSSGKGADTSGEDNHWDDNNLAVTDQTTDTPTNNFATLRIAQSPQHAQVVLSEGNCDFDFTGGGSISARRFDQHVVSNFAMTTGKWYCEAKEIESWRACFFGISNLSTKDVTTEIESWIAIYGDTGDKYIQEYTGESVSNSAHGDAIGANATILIALDMDNKNVYFGQRLDSGEPGWSDGSDFNQSSPTSAISISSDFLTIDGDGSSVVFYFAGGGSSATPRFQVNFGNPVQSITSGNADANGYGNFECTVPSGYYALCTKNLAEYG